MRSRHDLHTVWGPCCSPCSPANNCWWPIQRVIWQINCPFSSSSRSSTLWLRQDTRRVCGDPLSVALFSLHWSALLITIIPHSTVISQSHNLLQRSDSPVASCLLPLKNKIFALDDESMWCRAYEGDGRNEQSSLAIRPRANRTLLILTQSEKHHYTQLVCISCGYGTMKTNEIILNRGTTAVGYADYTNKASFN